jgi:cytoskeletal protein CcmA (bactofilin family)
MAIFNREVESSERHPETVIGSSVKVEGNFIGSGNVNIEGMVNGSLKTSKDLRIGGGARVKADIEAANIVVAGEIHGNVKTTGMLELSPSGKIIGNVETNILIVAKGAVLNGKCTMIKGGIVQSSIGSPAQIGSQEKKRSS